MDKVVIKALTSLNKYLSKRESKAEAAFNSIADKITSRQPDFVCLHFTYENIEAILKYNTGLELFMDFEGVLSQYKIDNFDNLKINHRNVYQDLMWSKLNQIKYDFIEVWLVKCFKNSEISQKINCPFYFKNNYDSMEITDLQTGYKFYERKDFDWFYNINKENTCLDVLSNE